MERVSRFLRRHGPACRAAPCSLRRERRRLQPGHLARHCVLCAGEHEQAGGKLGPSLVEVGCAAAEVGLQAKEVRFRPVGGPGLVVQAALHLVRLLVVLVRPHVVGECAGQRVEGELSRAGRRATGSPAMASECSSENMYSTTVHSSEPCDGSRPARCSSQENMPLGRPYDWAFPKPLQNISDWPP